PGRYRLHDLLALYARERVQDEETESDREAGRRRMFAWYLDTADAADRALTPERHSLLRERSGDRPGPISFTHDQAAAWFDAEWASLVAAAHQAAEFGFNEIAWQIRDALYSFAALRMHWAA